MSHFMNILLHISLCIFYDHINTIYQFITPFMDKKCLIMMNMETLNLSRIKKNVYFRGI